MLYVHLLYGVPADSGNSSDPMVRLLFLSTSSYEPLLARVGVRFPSPKAKVPPSMHVEVSPAREHM